MAERCGGRHPTSGTKEGGRNKCDRLFTLAARRLVPRTAHIAARCPPTRDPGCPRPRRGSRPVGDRGNELRVKVATRRGSGDATGDRLAAEPLVLGGRRPASPIGASRPSGRSGDRRCGGAGRPLFSPVLLARSPRLISAGDSTVLFCVLSCCPLLPWRQSAPGGHGDAPGRDPGAEKPRPQARPRGPPRSASGWR